jgi:hypothetical protein
LLTCVAYQLLAIVDTIINDMGGSTEIAAAMRKIAKGFEELADAIASPPEQALAGERALALLHEWGDRGLTRAEASALFRKHGFAPQTAGGWARGEWIETRDDGRRYLGRRSRAWLAEQGDSSPGATDG